MVVVPLMKNNFIYLIVSQIFVVPEAVQPARVIVEAVPAAVKLVLSIR